MISFTMASGTNACNGANGTSLIDSCGTKTAFDEVLLQFANGDLLAHYSDGTNCNFTVTSDKKVNW
jgi:hypothetical protein